MLEVAADLGRSKRVRWIAWVIAAAETVPLAGKGIPSTKRGTEHTWALWVEDEGYVVILWERNGYYLLKTAFPVNYKGTEKALERDWLRYSRGR